MQNDSLHANFKYSRILQIYSKLLNGDIINKENEAKYFNVSQRSIQRDIDDLRIFFEDQAAEGINNKELVYSRKLDGYYLKTKDMVALTNSEVLAVCKILLDSRAFCKDEITPIIERLVSCCTSFKNRTVVKDLISNEIFHYVEPQHKKKFVNSLWDIGVAIREHKKMKICYRKQDNSTVERIIKPVGIMFSEYYFYLTAFIDNIDKEKAFVNKDDIFPTIYRIDRIQQFEVLNEHFDIPYKDRFEEGEFRKRIQFMYGGKLRRIKFKYIGNSLEAILDRLPTSRVLQEDKDGYIITAEVFGDGIDMWIRSQGDMIQIIQ